MVSCCPIKYDGAVWLVAIGPSADPQLESVLSKKERGDRK